MDVRNIDGRDPNYDFIAAIGQGGFGTVVKVRRKSDRKIMACKMIDCSRHQNIIIFARREIEALSSFADSERYIAKFSRDLSWVQRTGVLRLYMDFYEGGDLQGAINRCKHEDMLVHPFMATYWAMEIARGVKACHDYGIIHRDLKPGNVLLARPYEFNDMLWSLSNNSALAEEDKDLAREFSTWLESRPPWCHITDFGLGKISGAATQPNQFTPASFNAGLLGTPGFIAPEALGNSIIFSVKSDIYSLGCLLYNLCTCNPPPANNPSNTNTVQVQIGLEYPRRLAQIIQRCLDQNPEARPNSREVANEISEAYIDILEDAKYGQMRTKLANAFQSTINASFSSELNNPDANPGGLSGLMRSLAQGPGLNRRLREALYQSDAQEMKAAIYAGADVDIPAFDEESPKSNAYIDVVAGIKHSTAGASTEGYAKYIEKERIRKAEEIISTYHATKLTLLGWAIIMSPLSCLAVLLDSGALYDMEDVDSNPLLIAARHNSAAVIEYLVTTCDFDVNQRVGEAKESALAVAARFANPDAIQTILKLHGNPRIKNLKEENALHLLGKSKRKNNEGITYERCYGLVIKAASMLIFLRDEHKKTPLYYALLAGRPAKIIDMIVNSTPNLPNSPKMVVKDLASITNLKDLVELGYERSQRAPIGEILGL
ncbi:Serine/threonine-protein kinase Nek2 [Orbilia ellipsospora]|uniref:non-specific serine/threonine protein kinase n=1 Tax=Orbilia ellipsospora TaxID=2528407 RepID=A0AAV9XFG6_9PEZI